MSSSISRFTASPMFTFLWVLLFTQLVAFGPRALAAQTVAVAGDARAAEVDRIIELNMQARRIPGAAVGVMRGGHLVYSKGYGRANLEWPSPVTPSTVFLLASVTKQFTAGAMQLLISEQRVALTDSLTKYIEGPASWNRITIADLLHHTAGLRDRFEQAPDGRMYLDYTRAQMLDAARATRVDTTAGVKWQYSDQGYYLLGAVIEKVTGTTYTAFLRDRIFRPLGMSSSSAHDWSAVIPERASGYALSAGRIVASPRRYQFPVVSHYGIQSSVLDLARYDSALTANAVLTREQQTEMSTPARLKDGSVADYNGVGYGMGWFVESFNGHRIVSHGGSTGTCIFRLPDDTVSVILLTNLEQVSGSDPCGIARSIAAVYVPSTSLTELKPVHDRDTAVTRRMRKAIEGFATGVIDTANYAVEARAPMRAAAAAQAASMRALGPLTDFLLVRDERTAGRVLYYRAVYREATIHLRYVVHADGRIRNISAVDF